MDSAILCVGLLLLLPVVVWLMRVCLLGPFLDQVGAKYKFKGHYHFNEGWARPAMHDTTSEEATALVSADDRNRTDPPPNQAGEPLLTPWQKADALSRLLAGLADDAQRKDRGRSAGDKGNDGNGGPYLSISWEGEWSFLGQGASRVKTRYGSFPSPALSESAVRDALPAASHAAKFCLVLPAAANLGSNEASMEQVAICVHLAATGEENYDDRLKIALPLAAKHGIGSCILENARYGSRSTTPEGDCNAQMPFVADTLSMIYATFVEVRGSV
jgi:hypothetical protein